MKVVYINKFKENALLVLFIIAGLLTEVHSICAKIDPSIAVVKRDWFLSATYKMTVEIQYYIKQLLDNLFVAALIFIIAVGSRYKKVRIAASVFMLYPVCDYLSFIWNFKETPEVYWVLLFCLTVSILIIIFHKTKMKAV